MDFLQNHDQIGNRAYGERLSLLSSSHMVEALTVALLLSPHIPLMFMGEEFASTRPFCFFADFTGEMARNVTEGRRREFRRFLGLHPRPRLDSRPDLPTTFEASKIDWAEADRPEGKERLALVRELLALRARHVVPHLAGTGPDCGRVLMAEEGRIAVDWTLDGALLQMRARLEDCGDAIDLPEARGTRLIRAGCPDSAPWTEIWWEAL